MPSPVKDRPVFGPDLPSEEMELVQFERGANANSKVARWWEPKLCPNSNVPKFYLKSLMWSYSNYNAELKRVHTKLEKKTNGLVIVPQLKGFAEVRDLVPRGLSVNPIVSSFGFQPRLSYPHHRK